METTKQAQKGNCPKCNKRIRLIPRTGMIAVHYTNESIPYACRGSLKQSVTDEGNSPRVRQLRKFCASLQSAEKEQNRLYNKFDKVTLVSAPRFSPIGEGIYAWEVA